LLAGSIGSIAPISIVDGMPRNPVKKGVALPFGQTLVGS